MFLPISTTEMKALGWQKLDVILVSGDAYIDSPFNGVALLGKYLVSKGFRVGVIAQPDIDSADDIMRLGEPELFWGVSAGCVDSMVANYTATMKPRKSCDFTPAGVNNRRPDRATIVYTGLIKRYSAEKKPIFLGGIEASLRRIAHYDQKTDKVRKSVLFDAKADGIIYGNGEKSILDVANAIKSGNDWRNVDGVCYISKEIPKGAKELPSFEEVASDKAKFYEMFKTFSENCDPISSSTIVQKTLDRYLVQNKPWLVTQELLDEVNNLEYERSVHSLVEGVVKAVDTIRFSITSHRGCFGSCAFCAISVHQGRHVVSRSKESILKEISDMSEHKKFRGVISDIGGATGNMYGMKCAKMQKHGACKDKQCLYPTVCPSMDISHKPLISLLKDAKASKGIKHVFASSGLRYDIIVADKTAGREYVNAVAKSHVSGQLKLAPESADVRTLNAMRKPNTEVLDNFLKIYKDACSEADKPCYLTYYFMVAHPASDNASAKNTRKYIDEKLKLVPEQVQIFTPTPSTWATCAYYTGFDINGRSIFVEKSQREKEAQKDVLTYKHGATQGGGYKGKFNSAPSKPSAQKFNKSRFKK